MRNQQPDRGDPILRLQRRIDELESRLRRLESQSRPTIPIYSGAELSDMDMNEGEFWITGGAIHFQQNGNDHKVTST